jgi:hypothetical protein
MDAGRAARQLRPITDITRAASRHDLDVWPRGGWAMDFFLGEVTRDHVDIEGMLHFEPGRIGQVRCPILSPEAQIAIKESMPVWVRGLPRRPKDAEDILRLRAAVRET